MEWVYNVCKRRRYSFQILKRVGQVVSTMQRQRRDIGRFDFAIHSLSSSLFSLAIFALRHCVVHRTIKTDYAIFVHTLALLAYNTVQFVAQPLIAFLRFFLLFFFRHIEQQLSLAGGGMNLSDESRTSIWTRNDSYSMIIRLTVLFGTSFTEFTS